MRRRALPPGRPRGISWPPVFLTGGCASDEREPNPVECYAMAKDKHRITAQYTYYLPAKRGPRKRISSGAGPKPLPLKEVLDHVDLISALPDLDEKIDGWTGTKGFVSVLEFGFILHAYFEGSGATFEMYRADNERTSTEGAHGETT